MGKLRTKEVRALLRATHKDGSREADWAMKRPFLWISPMTGKLYSVTVSVISSPEILGLLWVSTSPFHREACMVIKRHLLSKCRFSDTDSPKPFTNQARGEEVAAAVQM